MARPRKKPIKEEPKIATNAVVANGFGTPRVKNLVKTKVHQTIQNSATVTGEELLAILEANGLILDGNTKVTIKDTSKRSYYSNTSLSISKNVNYKISCTKTIKTETESEENVVKSKNAVEVEDDHIAFELE